MIPAGESTPLAQGQLAQTPFLHLVLYLHRQGQSGTLVLVQGERQIRLLFHEGLAVAARGLPAGCGLSLGMLELCSETEASYAFWNRDVLGDGGEQASGSVDPFMLAAHSLRGHVPESVVSSVVDRYRGVELRAAIEATPERFGLDADEARLLEALRGRAMTTEAMVASSSLDGEQVRRFVYLLLITRMVAPVETSKSSSSGVRAASTAPAGPITAKPSAGVIAGTAGQPQRTASSSRPNHPSVQPAQVAPRTSPRPASAESQSEMPVIVVPAMPAWQQLASMRPGGSIPAPSLRSALRSATPRPMPSIQPPPVEPLDNAAKLKRAELLAERRKFDEVKRIVDEVLTSEPKHADALALRAWTLYQTFDGDDPSQELLQAIEGALRINQAQPQALYVKALVMRRIGREPAALRFFKLALDADPRHVEAARELRLAKMRRDR